MKLQSPGFIWPLFGSPLQIYPPLLDYEALKFISVLDTLIISLHTLYLSDLVYFHGLKYHLHAVDNKIYIPNPGFFSEL